MLVRGRTPTDHDQVAAFLAANHSARVARRGAVCRPLDHPALLAVDGTGALAGVLTYALDARVLDGASGQPAGAPACEILTLHTARQWQGTGTVLVRAVTEIAVRAGCHRLWLITTNDNVDALRFYQRRGFRLSALFPGAVDTSRARLKPEIPTIGAHGIPIRDELRLEHTLRPVEAGRLSAPGGA